MPLFLIAHWRALAVLALVCALGAYGAAMRLERDSVRAEYAEFRTKVAQAVEAASAEALKHTIADEKRKEEADAEHEAAVAALNARIASLRARRAGGDILPATTACPDRPASACLDRAQLERALRDLDAGVQGLVDEGSRAVTDLDAAKRWAQP